MKSAHKLLKIVLLVVVVSVFSIVVLIHLFGNSIMKAGIETAASKTLSVGVNIDDIDLSILGGSVGFQNLIIDNPPGYQHDKLLEVGKARIAVSLGSLLKDTVNIKEIVLDNVNIVLEQKGVTSNNLQDIIKAIPQGKGKPKEAGEKPAKKLHIDNLEITNITVKAKLLPVPGQADTITLKLDPIRMTNLGSDDKLDVAELTGRIFLTIATGVAKQGAGQLPDDITNEMKATLSQATELGKATVEEGKKILEEGAKTGEELMKGVQDLLKPKK